MCRCLTMCTHLPVMDLNNIWITVFSPCCYRIVLRQSDILVLYGSFPGETGTIWWAWPLMVCWCSMVCTHLPIISVDNRIGFTVFSPCCHTHRSDQRLTGHSGAFWRFLGILFLFVCFFPPDSQIFKGVIVKYK